MKSWPVRRARNVLQSPRGLKKGSCCTLYLSRIATFSKHPAAHGAPAKPSRRLHPPSAPMSLQSGGYPPHPRRRLRPEGSGHGPLVITRYRVRRREPGGDPAAPIGCRRTSTAAAAGRCGAALRRRPRLRSLTLPAEGPHGPSLCETAGSPRGIGATNRPRKQPRGPLRFTPASCAPLGRRFPALRAPLKSARCSDPWFWFSPVGRAPPHQCRPAGPGGRRQRGGRGPDAGGCPQPERPRRHYGHVCGPRNERSE